MPTINYARSLSQIKDQKLLSSLGPEEKPGRFLPKIDGQFKVVYRGAIDDNAQSEEVKVFT